MSRPALIATLLLASSIAGCYDATVEPRPVCRPGPDPRSPDFLVATCGEGRWPLCEVESELACSTTDHPSTVGDVFPFCDDAGIAQCSTIWRMTLEPTGEVPVCALAPSCD